MRVTVTQEDIDTGRCYNKFECPIARAIRRLMPEAPVEVQRDYVFWTVYEGHRLPPEAQKFIQDFDAKKPVAPFEFEVV